MIKVKQLQNTTKIFSDEAFNSHYELYKNYCVKYNEIQEELKEYAGCPDADKNYSRYRGIKKEEAHNLNAITLHELFFKNISDNSTNPQEHFTELVQRFFGSFEDWQKDFIATAKASRGWVVTVYEQRSGEIKNMLIDNHDIGVFISSYPLLVLDCWEHSYIMDCHNNIDKYIEKFLHNIDWRVVETRSKAVEV